ncbi:MAG TPA: glutaredoxin family protein [Desulfomicrobiaceae bacterium]|nr:glutaredoxin family protein [Desulfomicrobiaceae bacterium]
MENDIKLYALSTCIHCKNAKEFLEKCGVEYDCVYVDELQGDERQKMVEEIKKINPKLSFPTVIVNGTIIVGFKKDQITEALKQS